MGVDDIIESRLRYADTRRGAVALEAIRVGIMDYILTAAFEQNVPRGEVPCPPLERWGVRPLPAPTRVRLYNTAGYASLQECVEATFYAVRESLAPVVPAQAVSEQASDLE